MGKYFETDGVRGKASRFDEHFLNQICYALAMELKTGADKPQVLISGDTRESTKFISDTMSQYLTGYGINVIDAGVIPTPANSNLISAFGCDVGIMITASHNPAQDNGIKILDSHGLKANDEFIARLEDKIDNLDYREYQEKTAKASLDNQHQKALDLYKNHLLTAVDTHLDGLNVMLDCANGATGVIADNIFTALGANVKTINTNTDYGTQINNNCGSTHLEMIKASLPTDYDLGAAFDGDGDRVILVARDEAGIVQEYDGDFMIAIIANQLLAEGKLTNNSLTTTIMVNPGLTKWAAENNVNVECTKVGDTFVKENMDELGIAVGGEQSGHIILKNQNTGDGILTALTVAEIMKKTGKSLPELASIIKKMPQKIINIPATNEEKAVIRTEAFAKYTKDKNEELKGTGSINIRPSGTEPLIRLTVWGETDAGVAVIEEMVLNDIKTFLSQAQTSQLTK